MYTAITRLCMAPQSLGASVCRVASLGGTIYTSVVVQARPQACANVQGHGLGCVWYKIHEVAGV